MFKKVMSRFIDLYLKNYIVSISVVLAVFLFFLYSAFKLSINSNQLDLLPESMPQIQEARKITEMVGGTGYMVLGLKIAEKDEGDRLMAKAVDLKVSGYDEKSEVILKEAKEFEKGKIDIYKTRATKLKEASERLYTELKKLNEVRFIQHRFSLDFIQNHILYFMETEDLKEGIKRVSIKRDEMIEKANPFYIDLGQRNYKLDLTGIQKKYTMIGKQQIVDEYLVSPDYKMLIMLVKPDFSLDEIERSRQLTEKVRTLGENMHLEKEGIELGFTGAYIQYVDAYDSVQNSLRPTITLSTIGIIIVLLIFLRKKRMILILITSLIAGEVFAFGITYFVIGKLNIITAIFGGVLGGLGIDFGIHYSYRFREEYWKHEDLLLASKEAILNTGLGIFVSAVSQAAGFAVLTFSEFRGFSEFGLISAYGLLVMAAMMIFLTPLLIVVWARLNPGFLEYMKIRGSEDKEARVEYSWLNFHKLARIVFPIAVVLFSIGLILAPKVGFDDDYRHMLEADLPSEKLKQEINFRYDVSSDPLVIETDSLDDARSLWEYLEPLPPEMKEWIAQTVSIYSFVPDSVRQIENQKLIDGFRRNSTLVKYSLLPDDLKPYWSSYQNIISQKPFQMDELPDYLKDQFHEIPASPKKGWITLIYPDVGRINRAEDVETLDRLIGQVTFPVVGRGTIRRLAFESPEYAARHHLKITGSNEKRDVQGMSLSEREINGVLALANAIDEKDLVSMNFSRSVIQEIITKRPFHSLDQMQATKITRLTTGQTILISKFIQIVKKEAVFILTGTITLVVTLLYFSLRGLRKTIIALSPLIISLGISTIFMTLFNIKLNYFNFALIPIIIGSGIDNGVFILDRYLENGSISHALHTTGRAVVASSLTNIVGWGSLIISAHPGIRSMGVMSFAGLITVLIVSVTVTPAILQFSTEGKLPWLLKVLTPEQVKENESAEH
jgi:uncharacterized protein